MATRGKTRSSGRRAPGAPRSRRRSGVGPYPGARAPASLRSSSSSPPPTSPRSACRWVLALDQGTTGSTALVFDERGRVRGRSSSEFPQHYPRPAWVEHDPEDLWRVTLKVGRAALRSAKVEGKALAAVGIANQRETTLAWDARSGRPLGNAIVWQDRRTAPICERWRADGLAPLVRERTGLVVDSYFSAPKIRWMMDHVMGLKARVARGEAVFGTVDSWLAWRLTATDAAGTPSGGRRLTDVTNASRTMLFDIRRERWDPELLDLAGIGEEALPEVVDSSGEMGSCNERWFGAEVPLAGIAGDQQAALFGQACFSEGMVKNTYGTGCFTLLNTGARAVASTKGLLTTIAWRLGGRTTYALEGSVFIAGGVIQWLRDGLRVLRNAAESQGLAASVEDSGGVVFVPAFTGLGAPWWDESARGVILGITRGTSRAHVVRAALESIAQQSEDVLGTFASESGARLKQLRVDGGATANGFLCQYQADLSELRIERPVVTETTAQGAAYLAGLGVGLWKGTEDLAALWRAEAVFEPEKDARWRAAERKRWQRGVERARGWHVEG